MFGVDYSRNAIDFCNKVFKDSKVDYKLGDGRCLNRLLAELRLAELSVQFKAQPVAFEFYFK